MSFLARAVMRSLAPTFMAPTLTRASSSRAFAQAAQGSSSQTPPDTPNPEAAESSDAHRAESFSATEGSGSNKRFLPDASHIIPSNFTETDPDKWWKAAELGQMNGNPGNNFSGRSIPVRPGGYVQAYHSLKKMMYLSQMKREIKIYERHEKPSTKKRRLKMERHRRRFQEEVGCVVDLANSRSASVWLLSRRHRGGSRGSTVALHCEFIMRVRCRRWCLGTSH